MSATPFFYSLITALAVAARPAAVFSPSPSQPQAGEPTSINVGMVCPTENEEARQLYNTAILLEEVGKPEEAEHYYLRSIELDPAFCDAMDNLGRCYRKQGRYEQAINWYRRSLSIAPDNPVAHMNLAVVYDRQGKSEVACAEYRWLTRHNPKDPEGYYGLGRILVDNGDTAQGLRFLEIAEKLYVEMGSPLVADARHALGIGCYNAGDFAGAKRYFELIYDFRPQDPALNYYLGLCCLNSSVNDPAAARRYLEKARSLGVEIPPEIGKQIQP